MRCALVVGRNGRWDTLGRVDPCGFDELSRLVSRGVGDGMRVLGSDHALQRNEGVKKRGWGRGTGPGALKRN